MTACQTPGVVDTCGLVGLESVNCDWAIIASVTCNICLSVAARTMDRGWALNT